MKPGKSVVSHFSTIQDNDDRRFPVRLKLQVQNPKVKTQYATRRKPEGKLCTRSRSYEQDRARRIPTSNGHSRNLGLRNISTASIAHALELGGTKTRSHDHEATSKIGQEESQHRMGILEIWVFEIKVPLPLPMHSNSEAPKQDHGDV
jgi:hypothetical protein